MRTVAARLGTGVMSLYNYIPDKQGLVHAMVAFVARDQRYPEPSGDWRADLHQLALQQRALLLRHPWLADAVTPGQPISEELVPSLEFGLAALEPLHIDPPTAMETIALITGSVLNLVRAENAARTAPAPDPEQQDAELAEITRVLGTGKYPRLAAAIAARAQPPGPQRDLSAEFDRILDRILDGLIPSAHTLPGLP
jgi:AcrR family transcriptional regulator